MAPVPPTEPLHLDALGPRGTYRTRVPSTVTDVAGDPIARLSLVPPLYFLNGARLLGAGPP